MALVGELILVLSAYRRFPGRVLGVSTHVAMAEGTPQPVVDQGIDHGSIPELHSSAISSHEIRCVRHRLHPPGHRDPQVLVEALNRFPFDSTLLALSALAAGGA